MAQHRDVEVVTGIGERMTYRSGSFYYARMMTVICFPDNVSNVFKRSVPDSQSIKYDCAGFIEHDREIFRYYRREPEKGS